MSTIFYAELVYGIEFEMPKDKSCLDYETKHCGVAYAEQRAGEGSGSYFFFVKKSRQHHQVAGRVDVEVHQKWVDWLTEEGFDCGMDVFGSEFKPGWYILCGNY